MEQFEEYIKYASLISNIEPELIKAIIMTESSGNPNAESPYARGLMQLSKNAVYTVNRVFGYKFTYDDMFNSQDNIICGTMYFKWLVDYFKRKTPSNIFYISYAIMSYNWGLGNVVKWLKLNKSIEEIYGSNKWIDEMIPAETKAHLLDVIWWYNYFKMKG